MFVDSHCHLDMIDLERFKGSFDDVLGAARGAHIEHMLCVSVNLEDYPRMRALVEDQPDVSVSVGVHPNETEGEEPTVERLIEAAHDPRVVAVGETGLDYYRSEPEHIAAQQARFRRHIAAARAVHKPLIIHTRDAKLDTLRILHEEGADQVGGVLHCFTEDWEMAQAGIAMGFAISFSGIVTFKNAVELKEVARRVPTDWLLIETDSPYLAPVPHRGKLNHPALVVHVADHLAELRETTVERIAEVSRNNFYRIFGRGGGH